MQASAAPDTDGAHLAAWRYTRGVRFLLASLYRAEYRALIAAEGIPLDVVPDVVDVACPRCGALYVAELAPDEEPWELEAREWMALCRLNTECPNHAHRFVVSEV